ncbi:MAG: NAD(P)/FAD-dependent oxidoreductase [Flavobacteriales bacterium]
MNFDLIILGGGAAGVFAACNAAELRPGMKILLIEKSNKLMAKIRISGGGRCNVTHACYEPKMLVKNYPRGQKELLGSFYQFQPNDTIDWFERRGVALKTESDGRIFPTSDKSSTIIDCLNRCMTEGNVTVITSTNVHHITKDKDHWTLTTTEKTTYSSPTLLIATGSSPAMIDMVRHLGHSIVTQVPSLFTFQIDDSRITGLQGLSVPQASVRIEGTKFEASGPLLITHWGLSGPGILKLSAFAARELAELKYQFTIRVQWDKKYKVESALEFMLMWRGDFARQSCIAVNPFRMPQRLWQSLIADIITTQQNWGDLNKKQMTTVAETVSQSFFHVKGKSTFKDEFVTAGGVALSEVDFRTMESKLHKGLYFAGEVLDIDGITGGFNFQAAWTTAYIAAKSVASEISG